MTLEETARLMKIISIAYPNFHRRSDITKRQMATKVWQYSLSDIPFSIAQKAFFKLVKTNTYAPSIAEFVKAAEALRAEENDFVLLHQQKVLSGKLPIKTTR